jgi:hypothetical protein
MKHVRISAKQREQEWNISRKELMEIVEIGILSEAELEQIISSDFNPVRSFSDHALLSTNSSFPFNFFFLLCRIDVDLRIKVKSGWRTFFILVFRKLSAGAAYKSAILSFYCASYKIWKMHIGKMIECKYDQTNMYFILMA